MPRTGGAEPNQTIRRSLDEELRLPILGIVKIDAGNHEQPECEQDGEREVGHGLVAPSPKTMPRASSRL